MIKLIITGTIGSGKSTVMKMIKECVEKDTQIKFEYIDFDQIVNDFYDTNSDFKQFLINTFGTSVKSEVSSIVFGNNPEKLEELNFVVGDMLNQYFINLANSNANLIIEVPYYFEMLLAPNSIVSAVSKNFTSICISMEDEEKRIKRILERSKITHPHFTDENIQTIIKSQLPSLIKESLADIVIFNDGDEEDLQIYVAELINNLSRYCIDEYQYEIDLNNQLLFSRINENVLKIVDYKIRSEEHRMYHTVAHLNNMINHIFYDVYPSGVSVTLNESLVLAILFHDIVYDPKLNSNELESIEFMKNIVKLVQPDLFEQSDIIEMAEIMIRSTIDHTVPNDSRSLELNEQYPYFFNQLKLFLDLDLCVFVGIDRNSNRDLLCYDDDIRLEYNHVIDELYYPARVKVLENFLAKEKIFMSEYFLEHELIAREHIQMLIERNKKKVEK